MRVLWQNFWLPGTLCDAHDRRPSMWASVLGGAVLGLAWGAVARLWMRLISANPEFSVSGTMVILGGPAIVGTCAGFAFAARRRRWQRALYLPRVLAVASFLFMSVGAGIGMVIPVLLVSLAVTQARWWRVVRGALLLLALAAVGAVSRGILVDKPGVVGVIGVLFFLLLLYPLLLAMRTGLEPVAGWDRPQIRLPAHELSAVQASMFDG